MSQTVNDANSQVLCDGPKLKSFVNAGPQRLNHLSLLCGQVGCQLCVCHSLGDDRRFQGAGMFERFQVALEGLGQLFQPERFSRGNSVRVRCNN